MANLNFFAARQDLEQLFKFIFEKTDAYVFGPHPEGELRYYRYNELTEILNSIDLGIDKNGSGFANDFCLWSPSVFRSSIFHRILNYFPDDRYMGPGTIQLHLGGKYKNQIIRSHFGHFSEKGAKARDVSYSVFDINSCNWKALNKLSNRIQYQIKYKLSYHHVPGHPILSYAYKAFQNGFILKESEVAKWKYDPAKRYDT